MADKTINDLSATTTLNGGDLFEIENTGNNSRKITATNAANSLKTLGFRGALVTKSADQTAANYTSATAITWDSEAYDTDSIHDTVTNNTRLTVPTGATYVKIGVQLALSSISSNGIFVQLFKNGLSTFTTAGTLQTMLNNSDSSNARNVGWTPAIAVTPGDYFEVKLVLNTDTSITVSAGASWFAMEVVA